eukprot:253680-Alexandrium_andersonii.AAC.1
MEVTRKKPSWALSLSWMTPRQARKARAAQTYTFGYDTEHRLGWRCAVGSDKKELATRMQIDEGQEEFEGVFAVWEDGSRKQIPQMTVGEWQSMARSRQPASKKVWAGQHKQTANKLEVRPRQDRELLMSLFEQGQQ